MENKQAEQNPLLPEIWRVVFSFIDSEEDLLNCSSVCSSWANIIETLAPMPSWSPWFSKNHKAEAAVTFLRTPGTRFEHANDIKQFLKEMELRPLHARDLNPFINRTVIVDSKSPNDLKSLLNDFPEFCQLYGHFVTKLLYFIPAELLESCESLREVFKTMRNLESLIISCPSGGYRIRTKNGFTECPQLEHLKELEMQGDLFYLLQQIGIKYGRQIQSLHWWSQNCSSDQVHRINQLCSNLKDLKILAYQAPYPSRLNCKSLGLKRFAYKALNMNTSNDWGWELCAVVAFAADFAATLEMMSVYVPLPNMIDSLFLVQTQFPVLKELAIPFFFVERLPLLLRLLKSFPCMQRLILVDTNDDFRNKEITLQEIKNVEPLRSQLPATVKEIWIRFRKFNEELRQHFPKVYKFSQPGVEHDD